MCSLRSLVTKTRSSHIDWHLEIGLAVVFAEDTDTVSIQSKPTAWDDLCPIYDALPASDH
ncbi:hypothetical protein FPV67DRAFT_1664884 [Lyophyllum atratum]|nr:hypothetical protein FPV67DRAFT_1664884 [Lyophyllum atratum]